MVFAYLVEEVTEVFACLVEVVFAYLVEVFFACLVRSAAVLVLSWKVRCCLVADDARTFLRSQALFGAARRRENFLSPRPDAVKVFRGQSRCGTARRLKNALLPLLGAASYPGNPKQTAWRFVKVVCVFLWRPTFFGAALFPSRRCCSLSRRCCFLLADVVSFL